MRIAVTYKSIHHGNTRRVAEAIAAALATELYSVEEAAELDANQFDLVGLGSGIYFYRHHNELRRLVASWPKVPPKSFVFSTAASRRRPTGGTGAWCGYCAAAAAR